MPRTNAPNAAAAYAAARLDVARLVDVLEMELARHDERAKADPRNRGFEGNLGKVRGDLMNTIGFLTGMEPNEIQAFLDDANATGV